MLWKHPTSNLELEIEENSHICVHFQLLYHAGIYGSIVLLYVYRLKHMMISLMKLILSYYSTSDCLWYIQQYQGTRTSEKGVAICVIQWD